ncbi:DUF3991 and toprim domain-containing protein [Bradyrhizobium sp. CCGUVB23]|uniref:DUF3991 and toprim domain-containing protein n=1 Tax=Bradyrhizobium sp. CCGUVB23 TaxID=2949630 RepID=UPI0020B1F808|nr:DUF3991 and toprim domain-containing protein [Bradyrhizobium sp. CCGUVB23]MCP3468603.1 DUF3991 and toprim domain-containing protein [Bradyrhizobium sp. CCGUVB23]
MAERDIDQIKAKVPCSSVLESNGWKVDLRESTPKAVKYRRGDGEVIIVIHQGRGWFDPTSEAKGDVFTLAQRLGAYDFSSALKVVTDLVGFEPSVAAWQRKSRQHPSSAIAKRWSGRPRPVPGSAAWTYLTEVRAVPDIVVARATDAGKLREGPKGSIWAAHLGPSGQIVGWEERGPNWRGFATGGAKALFCLGNESARRVCVTEAAIDAMSLAGIEGGRSDTIYASTGGGWAPATQRNITALASRPGTQLVAACDANDQGDAYAARLRDIAIATGASFLRLWPDAIDWNDQITEARTAG